MIDDYILNSKKILAFMLGFIFISTIILMPIVLGIFVLFDIIHPIFLLGFGLFTLIPLFSKIDDKIYEIIGVSY